MGVLSAIVVPCAGPPVIDVFGGVVSTVNDPRLRTEVVVAESIQSLDLERVDALTERADRRGRCAGRERATPSTRHLKLPLGRSDENAKVGVGRW